MPAVHAGPNLDHLAQAYQAACYVIAAITTAAILLMYNVHRNRSCPKCDHCKREARKQKEAGAEQRHKNYHFWTTTSASDCKDEDCIGRK